ncbi:MAG: hypothetical protein KIH01_03360 [Candidatus Freyarchaeota archaeon]|nr:hypothetical protein [Candidatus Jordarchaeia archaeon]
MWCQPETGDAFKRLVRLRNTIFHCHWNVDDVRIYEEAKRERIGSR